MNNLSAESLKQVERLDNQTFVLFFVIGAVLISIGVIQGYKKLIIEGEESTIDVTKLEDASAISAFITLIAGILFFYWTYEDYEKKKTEANANYLFAGGLAAAAAFIRYGTIIEKPASVEGAEDIV